MCGCVRRSTLPRFIWILQRFNRERFIPHRDDLHSVNGKELRPTGISALLTEVAVVFESPQPGEFYGGWISPWIRGPFKGDPSHPELI